VTPEVVRSLAVLLSSISTTNREDYFSDGITKRSSPPWPASRHPARNHRPALGHALQRHPAFPSKPSPAIHRRRIPHDRAPFAATTTGTGFASSSSVPRQHRHSGPQTYERNLMTSSSFSMRSPSQPPTRSTRLTHTPAPSPALDPEVHESSPPPRHLWVPAHHDPPSRRPSATSAGLPLDPAFAPRLCRPCPLAYLQSPITSNARPSDAFPLASAEFAEKGPSPFNTATQAHTRSQHCFRNRSIGTGAQLGSQLSITLQQDELLKTSPTALGAMFLAHGTPPPRQHEQVCHNTAPQLDPLYKS